VGLLVSGLGLGCGTSAATSGAAPSEVMATADAGVAAEPSDAGDAFPTLSAADLAALAALSPVTLPAPAADVTNRFADDPQAATFGQTLFFETSFSGELDEGDEDGSPGTLGIKGQTGKVSCAGCHVPAAGFLDDRSPGEQISLAAGWGRRRAPSLLDVGQAKLVMWDGRHDALWNQPFGPLESPVEMNSSRLYAAERLFALHRADYEALFGPMPPLDDATRFPPLAADVTGCQPSTVDIQPTCNGTLHGMPGDGAEFDGMAAADQTAVTQVVVNMGKAIGAFERRLACGPGRFDRWMHGDSGALSAAEQRGAQLFVGRGQCASCHSGPFFSDQKFHVVGVQPQVVAVAFLDADDPGASAGIAASLTDPLNVRGSFSDGDDGRLPAAVDPTMTGAFRTPTLRCASQRPSFLHTGQLSSLAQVVAFFARGGDATGYEGTNELPPLGLSSRDEADLVAFLGALEGTGPDASLLGPP
jgi:cytochrome c peroxidase